ncbi:hypothetical protein DM01DRAFT_1331272 [Hesseltinella vesiculosa]|uniref:Nucleotide-sugar transporter n=1 Tax=Hesseltinella vesiculosa TaxID=101127 RepID=A0A1X2GYN9_9FUNG|nr:hypothetical protein DM01DRAFT_1331272 [Hesseltinella vesiculosa]
MVECVKLLVCVHVLWQHASVPNLCVLWKQELRHHLLSTDLLYMLIPASLYAIQNNLLYIALSHLEAATFQVTYQLKILSTAMFSMYLLQRQLVPRQWLALMLLMMGVTLVQWSPLDESASSCDSSSPTSSWTGLIAVLLSCLSSGFAGCSFEKILKKAGPTNLWIRNLQLGLCTLLFAVLALLLNDWSFVWHHGFFYGYHLSTWIVIFNQALGVLLLPWS